MTADKGWKTASLDLAAEAHPRADAAVRDIMAGLLADTASQKTLSRIDLTNAALSLIEAMASSENKSSELP